MSVDPFISLRQAERLLREQGHQISYWQLWDRASRGLIPVETIAGRMLMHRDRLPLVAAVISKAPEPRQPIPADDHPF